MTIISVSLLAFQAQEAYAAAATITSVVTGDAAAGDSTATTKIIVTFSEANGVRHTGGGDIAGLFVVTGSTVNTAPLTNGACNTSVTTVTLTLAAALATDATPTVSFTNDGTVDTCDGFNTDVSNRALTAATDGLKPTFDSAATVTTTSITATFSESINAGSVVAGDFTISDGITVESVSVNGAVVTLTTSTFGSDATPTVTIAGNIDDAAAGTNNISTGNKVATDGNSLTAQDELDVLRGGTSTDNSPPSLGGFSGFNGVSDIDSGFSYNDNPTDVDGWKTDYPLVRTPVGVVNTLDLKVKDDKGLTNIYFVSINFGVPKAGAQGEAIVTYYPNQEQKIKIVDPNNLLGEVDFKVNPVKCKADSTTESCYNFSLDHSFNDAPIHDMVGITVADISRNVAYAYFNHGVNVYGDSLNPPVTETITNPYGKYTQQITLTQTDRAQDLWEDENENQWTRNIMGSWIKLTQEAYIVPDDNAVGSNGMKRINQHFAQYVDDQEILAKQIWDGSEIQSEIPDAIESNPTEKLMSTNDPELNVKIQNELKKAKIQWDSDAIQKNISDYFEFSHTEEILRENDQQLQADMEFENYKAYVLLNELYRTDKINQIGSLSAVVPEIMFEGTHNGALHVDYSKLQESKSVETDRAKEMLYKMYGKW